MKYIKPLLISLLILILSSLLGTMIGLLQYPSSELGRIWNRTKEEAGGTWKFSHRDKVVGPSFKEVVKPATDFLYSSAAISEESTPYLFSIPAINRYWVFQFMESDTDVFAYVGSRTHGINKPVEVLIVPKGYRGETYGLEVVELKTPKVWLLGRFQVYDEKDAIDLHNIQQQIRLEKYVGSTVR